MWQLRLGPLFPQRPAETARKEDGTSPSQTLRPRRPSSRDRCFVARASPRVPRRRRVARTLKGQWAKREARHGRRRGALFIWTRETRPRNARGGRGPRRGGWHLTRGEGLERRAWERIRETPTVRVVSEPWNGWTSRTGPRSCTPQATGTRGPAQRCVEGAASGPAAIGVETAVSVDATLSLHLGRTVSGCHVFIVTSS